MSLPTRLVCALMLLGFTAHGCSGTETGPSLTANVASGPLVYHGVYHADLEAAKSVAVHVPDVADSWQLTVDTVLPDGSRVEKDDVILTFVKETLEMDLRDELDKLEVAKAQRRKVAQSLERERIELQLEVDRRKLAVERAELAVVEGVNFVSELDVDKARLDVDKAKLELELAEDALEAFREKKATALRVEDLKVEAAQRAVDLKKEGLGSVEVRAPVSGVLYAPYTRLNWQRTKVAPGVVARPGDKILEIPDLSAYHAVMFARPRDAALISVGDEAVVYPTILPDRGIEATVIEKEDFATTRNEREGTETPAGNLKEHRIVLELKEAPTALRPGNTARVEISSVVSEDTLSVPLVALHESEDDGSRYVVLESGERREVSVGATTLTHAAIEEGLEGGDVVVLDAGKSPAVDDDSARGSTL